MVQFFHTASIVFNKNIDITVLDNDTKNKLREWLQPDFERFMNFSNEQKQICNQLIEERRSETGSAKTEAFFNINFEQADMNADGLNFVEYLEFCEAYKVQRTKDEEKLGCDTDLDDDRLEEFFNICKEISLDEDDNETVSMTDLETAFAFCGNELREKLHKD